MNMNEKIQQAIAEYFGTEGLDSAHQVRVWERGGRVWLTEPTIVEPDAERIELAYERGYGWRRQS